MPTSVTLSGVTFTDTDFSGDGYKESVLVDSVAYPRWQAFMVAAMLDAGKALTTTSSSSVSIGTGTKTFTMAAERPYAVGAFVTVSSLSNPTARYMHGQVTAVSGTTLTINSQNINGTGTYSDWTITISGPEGATGGLSGTATGAIDMGGHLLTTDAITRRGAVNGGGQTVYNEGLKVGTASLSGSTLTLDYATGNDFARTATANLTITPSNLPATGGVMRLKATNFGAFTITYSTGAKFAGGAAPTLTASGTDHIYIIGTNGDYLVVAVIGVA